jgi:hypothetical protein
MYRRENPVGIHILEAFQQEINLATSPAAVVAHTVATSAATAWKHSTEQAGRFRTVFSKYYGAAWVGAYLVCRWFAASVQADTGREGCKQGKETSKARTEAVRSRREKRRHPASTAPTASESRKPSRASRPSSASPSCYWDVQLPRDMEDF